MDTKPVTQTSWQIQATCFICLKGGAPGKPLNSSRENLEKIKEFANKRASFGETNLSPLCEKIASVTDEEYFSSCYHSTCYKSIVHSRKLNPQVPDGVYKPPHVCCRMGYINTLPFPALHLSRNEAIVFESLKISDQRMAKRY